MELPLQALGRTMANTFKRLIEAPWIDDQDTAVPSKRRIAAEEERFRLWARTLGLFQIGHASLDYRVRDASFVKASLTDLLAELQHHLENLLDIALGMRPPLERDEEARQTGATEHGSSFSDDEASLASSISSMGSFQEAEFRLSSVATMLDSLYKLASPIRSPRNRQQRSTKDLYKHVPESQRAEYMQNQEQIEVSLVTYVQQQQLVEWVDDEQLQELGFGQEELLARYASASYWLMARAGMANARRKQQFLYWKKHAQLLGRDMTEETPAVAEQPVDAVALAQSAAASSQAPKKAPAKSMATSATKMDLTVMGPDDMRSVISHRSCVSTVASPRGEDIAWPPVPSHLAGHKSFPCPYCGILCPERYLSRDGWRVHQTHDLQPYHCTYEDCSDPGRLYGVKQEWIDHENQHRRVWHCHSHEAEFETEPEYLHHLKEQHPENEPEDRTPEMLAAAVGASAKPYRGCPFCPTMLSDVTVMQKHVRYHLERLALYALPDMEEAMDDELASERPSDSHQVIENRGRQDSIGNDFVEERQAFLAVFAEDNFGRDGRTHGSALLTKANLELTQPSSPGSWLDTCLVSQQLNLAPLSSLPPVAASLVPGGSNEPYEPTLSSTALQNDWSEVVNTVLEMEEENGFVATNQQYIHQLGTAKGKWNVAKYNKKPGSSSSACISADMDSNQRKTLMADVLFSAGYSGASLLYRANLPPGGLNDTRPDDISSLRSIFFSFARASQTPGHAATAVKLLDTHVEGCLRRMEGDQESDHALWVSAFDITVVRIQYDALDQGVFQTPVLLEIAIGPFIKTGTNDLRSTFPRLQDHRALIPFYLHLSYALIRWNDFAYRTGQLVAVDDTLRMFIDRQLEPEGAHPIIDCLRDCLNWCIETLDQKPEIPTLLEDRQGDSLTGVYQIVGTLWRAYVTNTPTPSWPTPTWASSCEISSGMSAAELLITLICTAIARNLAKMSKPLDRAREGFNDLDELDRHALLHHFLHQLRRTSDPRMLAPRRRPANAVTELGKPPIFAAFLDFVTETLGVEGLAPADAAPIIPVVVARGG